MRVPCVICGLRLDSTNGPTHREYESGAELREHLVEFHSKYVANALLAPNPSNKAHFWLLANVHYGGSQAEQECLSAAKKAEQATSATTLLDDKASLAFLVEALAASTSAGDGDAADSVDDLNNKSPSLHDLFNFNPMNGDANNGHTKAKKKTSSNRKVRSEFDMDSSDTSEGEEENNGDETAEGNGDDANIIESFIRKLQSLQDNSGDGVDQPASSHVFDEPDSDSFLNLFNENSSQNSPMVSSSSMPEKPVEKREHPGAINDWTCHICWEESRYPGRHIAQKHLGKPLYECPLCEEFAGSYENCTVMKHIHKSHPEAFDPNSPNPITPISNLEKYAEDIRELQNKCFPNRPMKLARPTNGSRPRERHLCHLCNIQVAQSDRQRHVYHRHLCKTRIFQCPVEGCDFASNYDIHRVKWHLKWIHKEEAVGLEPISHEGKYREEIEQLNEKCFPDWLHRRKPMGTDNGVEKDTTGDFIDEEDSPSNDDEPSSNKKMKMDLDQSTKSAGRSNRVEPKRTSIAGDMFTCQLCYKEFKPSSNFLRHVAKDHLNIPLYSCPVCKTHGGQDAYDVRCHMSRVHGSLDTANLEPISNLEANSEEINRTYKECFPGRKLKGFIEPRDTNSDRNSQTDDSVKVTCNECGMDMKTEDRQVHVYRHHLKEPRLYECPECDFAHHACSSDVRAHIRFVHRENPDMLPRSNLVQYHAQISEWNERCFPGWINRRLPASVFEDFSRCRLCHMDVKQTSRHIAEVHLKLSLHKCPLCEYGAAESRLVYRHMKNNHKKKEIKGLEPIANVTAHRAAFSNLHDQCFPGRPKRLANIRISEEGKRTKCKKCGMTISKKRQFAHLLEKHLEKNMFMCKYCPFSSTHNKGSVETHLKDVHPESADRPDGLISELPKYLPELKKMAKSCFNDELKIIH